MLCKFGLKDAGALGHLALAGQHELHYSTESQQWFKELCRGLVQLSPSPLLTSQPNHFCKVIFVSTASQDVDTVCAMHMYVYSKG